MKSNPFVYCLKFKCKSYIQDENIQQINSMTYRNEGTTRTTSFDTRKTWIRFVGMILHYNNTVVL